MGCDQRSMKTINDDKSTRKKGKLTMNDDAEKKKTEKMRETDFEKLESSTMPIDFP